MGQCCFTYRTHRQTNTGVLYAPYKSFSLKGETGFNYMYSTALNRHKTYTSQALSCLQQHTHTLGSTLSSTGLEPECRETQTHQETDCDHCVTTLCLLHIIVKLRSMSHERVPCSPAATMSSLNRILYLQTFALKECLHQKPCV